MFCWANKEFLSPVKITPLICSLVLDFGVLDVLPMSQSLQLILWITPVAKSITKFVSTCRSFFNGAQQSLQVFGQH